MDYIDSISRVYAPVAQGIEHRPPEAGAAVRIRPGVYLKTCSKAEEIYAEIFEKPSGKRESIPEICSGIFIALFFRDGGLYQVYAGKQG